MGLLTPHFLYASALIVLSLVLAGCQSYKPKALDPATHRAEWFALEPTSQTVGEFAETLGKAIPDRSSYNPDDGLTVSEAEVAALVLNPDLRIARARAGVATVAAEHAGRWGDPELSLDVLKVTSSVPDPWIIGSSLGFTLPVSGRLRVEKARAEAAAHAELDRVAEAEWAMVRDLRRSWVEWSADRLRLRQGEAILDDLEAVAKSANLLAEAGEILPTEAALFGIESVRLRSEVEALRAGVAASRQEILSQIGLSPSASVDLHPAMTAGASDGKGRNPEDGNLTLRRLRAEYEVAEQTLRREIRKQFPDIGLGPQGEEDGGQSRVGFVGAIPIPILNSNRGGIAEAKAERELARAAYEAESQRIIGRVAVLRQRLGGIEARRESIHGDLVPLVDRQLSETRRLLQLGEGETLILLESLVRAHEAKLQLIEVERELATTEIEIGHLLGPAHAQQP